MLQEAWEFLKQGVKSFVQDDALSRGAAIAFYAVTGFLPALVTAITVLGAVVGHSTIQFYVARALELLMGHEGRVIVDMAAKAAAGNRVGLRAETVGAIVLIVTASGLFSEVQSALNAIWKTSARGTTMMRFLRARLTSLALVIGLGVLLLCSMLATAFVAQWHFRAVIGGSFLVAFVNFLVVLALTAAVFAAIYKVLPDIDLEWSDVVVGAVGTALLYEFGQILIGVYLYSAGAGRAYSIAGGIIIVLLWIYYSAQVFLLGAELTKIYATRRGSRRNTRKGALVYGD
jgi:membrane protein